MASILFVDDDQITQELVMRSLKAQIPDIQVECCFSFEEAHRLINKNSYDLYIFDEHIKGKEISGTTFLVKIREEDNWTPVCFYTGSDPSEITPYLQGYNCLSFVQKNNGVNDLLEQVRGILHLSSDKGVSELDTLESLARQVQSVCEVGSRELAESTNLNMATVPDDYTLDNIKQAN